MMMGDHLIVESQGTRGVMQVAVNERLLTTEPGEVFGNFRAAASQQVMQNAVRVIVRRQVGNRASRARLCGRGQQ